MVQNKLDYLAANADIPIGISSMHMRLEFVDGNTGKAMDDGMDAYMHAMLYALDSDYPYCSEIGGNTPTVCERCKGLVWINPRLSPLEVSQLIREYSLKLSPGSFYRNGDACTDKGDKQSQLVVVAKEDSKINANSNSGTTDGGSTATQRADSADDDDEDGYSGMAEIWEHYVNTH